VKGQHLQAFVWLRWRLLLSQLRRAGIANAIILALLAVACVALSLGLFAVFLGVGWGLLPLAEASLRPSILMWVWDGLVLAFLFCWTIGLMADLQRSDPLSLDKVLHLPVSPAGAFLTNYLSSFFSITLVIFLPAMFGLSLGLVLSQGFLLLVQFPLLAAFLLAVTALTYQFQGWLASLMTNPRRRRNVIVLFIGSFVLLSQLPQLFQVVVPRLARHEQELKKQYQQRRVELEAARVRKEVTEEEYRQRLTQMDKEQTERERAFEQGAFDQVVWGTRLANAILPPGWLPLGVASAAEGNPLVSLLGVLGLGLIAAVSLRRSYRTTVRLYKGEFTAGRRPAEPAPAPVKLGPASAGLLEKQLPFLSEQASAVALGGFRSLLRAPESKLILLSPLIMAVVFGSILLANGGHVPGLVLPLIAYGGTAVSLLGMVGLVGNQFGFDRDGFRVFVLCAAPRREILLGKNLAVAPLALGLGAIILVLIEAVFWMRVDLFLAAIPRLLSMYLLFCMLANWSSILTPMRINPGSFKASHPKLLQVLMQLGLVFGFPFALLPTLVPFGIQAALEELGGVRWVPVDLLLSAALCVGVIFLYRAVLTLQGRVLQARELKILAEVTTRE
jgi:hypothetical protein